MKTYLPTLLCIFMLHSMPVAAQQEIYPHHFNLEEVTLLDGPMKTAMERNNTLLLQYDADRLLTPFVRQAGLSETTDATSPYYQWTTRHPKFTNWGDNNFNLEGHVGGHYLTALALAYAANSDEAMKAQMKERLDYMIDILNDCQSAFDNNTTGLYGFIGGQPINSVWETLYKGDISALRNKGGWVPLYCEHKVLAGLRDAWIYGGSETAKKLFKKMADWSVNVVSKVSDTDMETILNIEHGGMNESLLDAYQLFGDAKYLEAAKKYSHKTMLNGMQGAANAYSTTFLDGKHANTQVPKYIGFQRISEQDATATAYQTAARNFWSDVAENRTVCIGGNSVAEHFLARSNSNRYIDQLDGPESCNTNNMLKLSEMLSDQTHDAKYADFYEYATWNHILSTQDPQTGGYVYFTTLRPQGYRIYSQANQGMWCCVGTGMENHSKYGHFIYTHDDDNTLYVNLFTASKLSSDDFALTQETSFPYEQQTRLTINKGGNFTLALRHPAWTTEGFSVSVNGEKQTLEVEKGVASYVKINRKWKKGDVVTVDLPMELTYLECPNYTDFIAFNYGPILLGAQTTAVSESEAANTGLAYEQLPNEYAGEGRMDHAPGSMATTKNLTKAPLLIGERDEVLSKITVNDLSKLTFTVDVSRPDVTSYAWDKLELRPFYDIHHARYMCYWYQQTAENYANSDMAAVEAANEALALRTIDFVAPGEQQSEAGHEYDYSSDSNKGNYNTESYRDAQKGGYIQYTLYNKEGVKENLSILCRFTTADAGRKATLTVDGTVIAEIEIPQTYPTAESNGFYNIEFPIPAELATDSNGQAKSEFVVRLTASSTTLCPGLYYLRLMKDYKPQVVTQGGEVRYEMDSGSAAKDKTFTLKTNGETENMCLVVRLYGNDKNRAASIYIDDIRTHVVSINNLVGDTCNLEFPIDAALLEGKEQITVRLERLGTRLMPTISRVYLCNGYTAPQRKHTPYEFVNTNFERNENVSITYNDDNSLSVKGTSSAERNLNLRMKKELSDHYSMLPTQYLFTICGQQLGSSAYLWWLCGHNEGTEDTPTAKYVTTEGTWLLWDIRKTPYAKAMNFYGSQEVTLQTSNNGDYSLACFGLQSNASDYVTLLTDIAFYSPEELADRYPALREKVESVGYKLSDGEFFAYNGFVYQLDSQNETATIVGVLSNGNLNEIPQSVFGYAVEVSAGIVSVAQKNAVSSAIYDLQGRRVEQPGRGIYIVNGKKIIK